MIDDGAAAGGIKLLDILLAHLWCSNTTALQGLWHDMGMSAHLLNGGVGGTCGDWFGDADVLELAVGAPDHPHNDGGKQNHAVQLVLEQVPADLLQRVQAFLTAQRSSCKQFASLQVQRQPTSVKEHCTLHLNDTAR